MSVTNLNKEFNSAISLIVSNFVLWCINKLKKTGH